MSPGLAGWVVKENPWGLGSGGEASARGRRSSFGPHPHLPLLLWAPLTTPTPPLFTSWRSLLCLQVRET